MLHLLKLSYSFLLGGWWQDRSLLRFRTCEFVTGPVLALAVSTTVVYLLTPGAFEEFLFFLSAVFAVLNWLFHI